MAKVKFVKDAYVNGELFASKDEIKDIEPKSSVTRWIRRGHKLAEEVKKEEEAIVEDSEVIEAEEDLKLKEAIDLDAMSKEELLVFCEDNDIKVDKRLGEEKIRDKVQEWLEENSEDVEDGL